MEKFTFLTCLFRLSYLVVASCICGCYLAKQEFSAILGVGLWFVFNHFDFIPQSQTDNMDWRC